MSDLIERLRRPQGFTGQIPHHQFIRLEAADEIERLRAERDELRRQLAEPKREPLTDEQIEAQIEARDALLDFISENGTASEGVQHYLDRYVRAALAAKDNGNAGE